MLIDSTYSRAPPFTPWSTPDDALESFFWESRGTATYNILRVDCAPRYPFWPPSLDSKVVVQCMSNGMWMDPALLSIRRCVRDAPAVQPSSR